MLCPARANAIEARISIRTGCPGIDQGVSLGIGELLPADWNKKASVARCGDLDALAVRYSGPPSSSLPAAPDLRAIALRLQRPDLPPDSPSLWNRFTSWLRRRLAPFAGWLKWLHFTPGSVAGTGLRTVLLVCAGVLIVLSLVTLIFTELRAAGLFGPNRRRRSEVRRRPAQRKNPSADGTADGDIDEAHALDRPTSALRMLIDALRRSRRIERDGNLTCREVLARAVFDTQAQRDGFAGIALLAERELFGPRELPMRVPDELRPTLQALYTQLLTAPAARTAAS